LRQIVELGSQLGLEVANRIVPDLPTASQEDGDPKGDEEEYLFQRAFS